MKSNLIGGAWIGEAATPDVNPSDLGDIVDEFAAASQADVRAAIEAAHRAFPAWRDTSIQRRFEILDAAGTEILARRQELGALLAREEGKILPEAIGEVTRAGQIFKFFAGEALRIEGDFLNSVRPGVDVAVTREPLGVIGVITPWNFPIAIPAWKIAPALAYGNCVVLKPADLTPASAWELVDILHRAGAPAGVINLVMGKGSVIGPLLLNDDRVKGISFTGSTQTGARVAEACARRGAKCQLEMGGKNPLLILEDADLDAAVDVALNGAYFSTGQRCTASSRIIVAKQVHDAFVEALATKTRALRVGDALEEGMQIGPVVDQRQLDQDLHYVSVGKGEGAELLCGGERVERTKEGYYMSAALFVGGTNEMRIAREEIFGPVAVVIRVEDFDEGVAVANDTPYGLSAGICTRSLKYATLFRRKSEAGMVMVNLPTAGVDYHVPFGGVKGSSAGYREQGRYAVEFFTSVKTSYVGLD